MKILLVIDHFGSGGAQRQIVELACGLKRRGHQVEVFAYFPERSFFRPRLVEHEIVVHEYDKDAGFSFEVVRKLAALVRERNIEIVISYLSSPNIYAEIAKLITPRAKLVVSERTSYQDDKSVMSAYLRRVMHVFADHIVTNSWAQHNWLKRKWWLKHKVSCIYNGLELEPYAAVRAFPVPGERLRLIAVGRIGPEKNALNLIRGLVAFQCEAGYVPEVSWVGERDRSPAGIRYCRQVDELLDRSPAVRERWRWLDVEVDVPRLLREHHALIHPSLYEGLPNVVCEALAAGMPVLVSNVCDHPLLVSAGERGFLFDPLQPDSIAAAIQSVAQLSADDWKRFSRNAQDYARENLSSEKMVTAYEALFARLLEENSSMDRSSRQNCS